MSISNNMLGSESLCDSDVYAVFICVPLYSSFRSEREHLKKPSSQKYSLLEADQAEIL